jgi:hypothetical protein
MGVSLRLKSSIQSLESNSAEEIGVGYGLVEDDGGRARVGTAG